MRDVAICGGGPAGSTLARRLSEAGLDVVVIDKRAFPRDKTCAGWVTPAVMQSLGLDLGDYGRANTLQPLHAFRVGVIGERAVTTPAAQAPLSYGIRRCEFDHYLLARCGAEAREATPVRALERTGGAWRVNGEIEARLLVGAGGHFCPVARALGADLGKGEPAVAAQEVEFRMTPEQAAECACEASTPELYFCPDLKGYGWVFRKGEYLNVGLGRVDNHRLSEAVADFCRWLVEARRLPADLPAKFKGHAYLLYDHSARPVIADRALLVGDAAGLAYPQSGEGIRPAIESALLAADCILAAGGDYGAARLAPYSTAIEARFGPRQARRPRPALERLKAAAAPALLANRWFASRVVVDRWFLHRQQAALPGWAA